jgi:hypothetical protein
MSRPALRPLRRLAAPLALLVLSACAGVTPIGDLLANPSRYEGDNVRIEGEVIGGVGALGVGGYQVRDETGTLTVVSEVGNAPATGTEIRVEGTFQSLLTIGTRSIAVLRERSRSVP